MSIHRVFPFTIFIVLILISAGSCFQKRSSEADKPGIAKIGVNLPLTGNASYFGAEFRKGLEFGSDEFNAENEDYGIKMIYEDNKFNPGEAVVIAKKFINIDDVDCIIAGYTPIVKALVPLINQEEVPFMASLTSALDVAGGHEWVFRDFILESDYMPILADYAYNEEGYRKGAYLVINDDFGLDARDYFDKAFTEAGGNELFGEVFEVSDMDLRNKIRKLTAGDPEFFLVVGRGSAMINACRQIRELDEDVRIYGGSSIHIQNIWDALGPAGDGIVYASIVYDENDPEFIEINKAFTEKYGNELNWLSIYGYTIIKYVSEGFREHKNDKNAIKQYLEALDVETLRGRLKMNNNSDVITPLELYRRKDGKSILLERN